MRSLYRLRDTGIPAAGFPPRGIGKAAPYFFR